MHVPVFFPRWRALRQAFAHLSLVWRFACGVACLLLAFGPGHSPAQTLHRCLGPNDQEYLDDKPCPTPNRLQQHAGIAPPAPPPPVAAALPKPPEVQAHHRYLSSPACRDLSEAVRTASSRGVGAEGVDSLNKEWSRRCRDEDALARQRYDDRQNTERKQRDDSRRQAEARSEQVQAEQERCVELGRILASRRAHPDSAPGSLADLQRFEASHRARCGNGAP